MKHSTLIVGTLSAAWLGLPSTAQANGLEGTFSGVVVHSEIFQHGPEDPGTLNGERVDGTFSFNVADNAVPINVTPDGAAFQDPFGQPPEGHDVVVRLTFRFGGDTPYAGRTISMPGESSPGDVAWYHPVVAVGQGTQPRLFLDAVYTLFVTDATLNIVGQPGSSFAVRLDPATFRPGAVDVSKSSAYLSLNRVLFANMQLDRVTFTPSVVPEPEVWLMLGTGAVLLAGLSSRSRGRCAQG